MTSNSRKIDPEWVVAIAAVVISLCALGVAIFQTRLMKKQQAFALISPLELGCP